MGKVRSFSRSGKNVGAGAQAGASSRLSSSRRCDERAALPILRVGRARDGACLPQVRRQRRRPDLVARPLQRCLRAWATRPAATDDEVSHMIQEADANADGYISLPVFAARSWSRPPSPTATSACPSSSLSWSRPAPMPTPSRRISAGR